jgi:hypothetical protein
MNANTSGCHQCSPAQIAARRLPPCMMCRPISLTDCMNAWGRWSPHPCRPRVYPPRATAPDDADACPGHEPALRPAGAGRRCDSRLSSTVRSRQFWVWWNGLPDGVEVAASRHELAVDDRLRHLLHQVRHERPHDVVHHTLGDVLPGLLSWVQVLLSHDGLGERGHLDQGVCSFSFVMGITSSGPLC